MESSYSEFVYKLLSGYSEILQKNKQFKKNGQNDKIINVTYDIQMALGLEMLIRFYNLPWTIHKSKDILSHELNIPGPIMQNLLDKFTNVSYFEGKSRLVRTKNLILKSFYYTVILALALSNFQIDAEPLSKGLKIENKEMVNKLKVINCKFPYIVKEKREEGEGKNKKKRIEKFIVKLDGPLVFNIDMSNSGRDKKKK